MPPDAENAGNAAATLAETGDILPIALAILAVAGCGVATFVLISRRNVVANSGSHAGISAVSNSMIKKAGILALAATLALTSALSFSKAFAESEESYDMISGSFPLGEDGYQIPGTWTIDVDINDDGEVNNIIMRYIISSSWHASDACSPVRINNDSYQWIYSLFSDDIRDSLLDIHRDIEDDSGYPGRWFDWFDFFDLNTDKSYVLREDLINDAYYNGGFDIEIPFEQQTKFDWTFDYGYEGSNPYIVTIDWRDINLGKDVSTYINVPTPAREGYEFIGWNSVYGKSLGFIDGVNDDYWRGWEGPVGDPSDINTFVKNCRWGDVTGFVAQWKQVDSTNDINANGDQTDSVDTDLNANVADVDTQDAVSEQNSEEPAQGEENNADLVESADLDASAVKED